MSRDLSLFEKGLPPLFVQASSKVIKKLQENWLTSPLALQDFLWEHLLFLKQTIENLKGIFEEFERKHKDASSESEKKTITLAFSKALGASQQDLRRDQEAFSRWFDFDAVADRCRHQISSNEREFCFAMDRLGLVLADDPLHSRVQFIDFLKDLSQNYSGNQRVKVAALDTIYKLFLPELSLDHKIFYDLAVSTKSDVWIQCKALAILQQLNVRLFQDLATQKLEFYGPDPDLFVRQYIIKLLQEGDFALIPDLFLKIIKDPSDFVRQSLCDKMSFLPHDIILKLLEDAAPQVRGMALLTIMKTRSFKEKGSYLETQLKNESDFFVLRVCLKCIEEGIQNLSPLETSSWVGLFEPFLNQLISSSPLIPIRRKAAQTREILWCQKNPLILQATQELSVFLKNLPLEKKVTLPPSLYKNLSEETLGRVLSLTTQSNFELELTQTSQGYKIYRGMRLRFRWWRFFYEFFHPGTDKRGGVRHTIGRHFKGAIQVPSAILSEFSETQVPGEPLYISEEGGYRPYLPLLDHALSTLQLKRPMHFYTSEGITSLVPPSKLWQRIKAKVKITFHFASIAKLRNWAPTVYWSPASYLKSLQYLGFEITFREHEEDFHKDMTISRFFPAMFFLPTWDDVVTHILSPYHINTFHLLFFVLLIFAYFLGRHMHAYRALKYARKRIPLVTGGWGTRGKSSTERLKSALICNMGLGLFSKTTGCEPMIMIAGPFQKMGVLPLYRPYDKASILEQVQVTLLADKFSPDVMLWECMGLKSHYVRIMQEEWMQDTFSTITNAFPDHEDVQGPTGYDVAKAMTSFIRPHGRLVTTEEEMLPYFQDDTSKKNTKLEPVGWLEVGLLTKDIMNRFPYIEHPQNVALILKIAEDFGINKAIALKEIADNVIPDIGALKVYTPSTLHSRSLQFVNGMSSNEKFSCLRSWALVGFDKPSPPGVWITTFINNRADRVARSQAFAELIVNNLSADRHFLFGTNLQGLMNFLMEEWKKFIEGMSPDVLADLAEKMRICITKDDLKVRFEAMGVKNYKGDLFNFADIEKYLETEAHPYSDEVLSFHISHAKTVQEFDSLQRENKNNDKLFKETITNWFLSKFILPEKDELTGDEMVAWVTEKTPPFYTNKIMGIQNIKGPGLEFVYRWEAWENCYRAGELLVNPLPHKVKQGFRNFFSIAEFGLLSKEYLEKLFNQKELLKTHKNEMEDLKNHIHFMQAAHEKEKKENHSLSNIGSKFFDVFFSLKRLKKAKQIYQDLSTYRISFFRASKELQDLKSSENFS